METGKVETANSIDDTARLDLINKVLLSANTTTNTTNNTNNYTYHQVKN